MRRAILYYGIEDKVQNSHNLSSAQLFSLTGGNSGNMAFVAGVKHILADTVGNLPWGEAWRLGETEAQSAIIPCANQFAGHCDMTDEVSSIQSMKVPVVAVGLGSQAPNLATDAMPPPGTVEWVRSIAGAAVSAHPNIVVRGHHTLRQLEKHGLDKHALPLGCPSNFISPNPNLGQQIAARAERIFSGRIRKVSSLAGQHTWPALRNIDSSLAALVAQTGGKFITQDPLEMYRFARSEFSELTPREYEQIRNHFFTLKSDNFVRSFAKSHGRIYFSVKEWMSAYSDSDIVIGPRIHGIVLALQAGIPGICVAHDSRTQELCEIMNVPWISPAEVENGITLRNIPHLFRFDPYAFDANRLQLAQAYAQFLANNELEASGQLLQLTNSTIRNKPDSVRGCIDQIPSPLAISGWAHAGGQVVHVTASRHGKVISTGVADLPRADLHHMNEGKVGFVLHLKAPLSVTEFLSGAIRIQASGPDGRTAELPVWSDLRRRMQSYS